MDIGAGIASGSAIFAIVFGLLGLVYKFWPTKMDSEKLALKDKLALAEIALADEQRKNMWAAINKHDSMIEYQNRRISIMENVLVKISAVCVACEGLSENMEKKFERENGK